MAIKNLNDVIHGDRADVRANQYVPANGVPLLTNNKTNGFQTERCYVSHPKLKIGDGTLIGGSCGFPTVKEAYAFIGFDWNMHIPDYAYDDPNVHNPHVIHHKISDMQAPSNATEFKKLVKWTADKLTAGETIHCGCIGGHGRTGTFICAVVKEALGIEDAINWVRENYCKKAVESNVQVDFLNKHFGILPAVGYKSGGHSTKKADKPSNGSSYNSVWDESPKKTKPKQKGMEQFFSPMSGHDIFKA
ncbi:tyrosine phosphatase domain-containing protein [Rhizobium phage RHph_TM16]|nr:tyrosine phosphatase domain-containing protein [Rhizobium phage RHph_TM16]